MSAPFDELTELLLQLPSGTVEPAELQRRLQGLRPQLLNLLSYKGPNAESRKQVDACRVTSAVYGEVKIDAEPDRRIILQLSDELKLDEVMSTELLIRANEERRMMTAEAAAGLHFEERLAAAKALEMLLATVSLNSLEDDVSNTNDYARFLKDFVNGLLEAQASGGGRAALTSRLVDLLKDTSLEPLPHSSLPRILDRGGHLFPRGAMLALEKGHLSKALLYACFLSPLQSPDVMSGLLDLIASLSTKIKAAGALFKHTHVHFGCQSNYSWLVGNAV